MNYQIRTLKMAILALVLAMLAAPAFGQTTDNSTWNGGTGFWNVSSEWTTNGQLGTVFPNNTASTVFNVTIDSGQQDIVTLAGPPAITINSLTLDGNPNFSSTLAIGVNGGAAGMLTLGSNTPASLTVNSLGNLDVNAQSELLFNVVSANGTVTNNGIINVGSAPGTAKLGIFDGGNTHQLTLDGAGTLTLSPGSAILGGEGDEELINSGAIQGAGTISNLVLVNHGTIFANSTTPLNIVESGKGFFTFENTGAVTVDSGSKLVLDTTAATNFSRLGLYNSGTMAALDGGTLQFKDSSTMGNEVGLHENDGAINVGGSGAGGTIEFDGSGALTTFDISSSSTLHTGTLTLSDNANNVITGVTGNETLAIEFETISGAGTISNLAFVNSLNGTVLANGTNALNIVPNEQGFINTAGGTVQVDSGSTMVIDTTAATNAGNEAFANVGGAVNALDGGTLEFKDTSGKTVGLENMGTINVGGTGAGGALEFDGAGTIFDLNNGGAGAGTLTLSDNANNAITGVTGTEALINDVGETISGAGTISNLGIANDGEIIANGTNALKIVPNANVFVNNGTLQANSGSTLVIDTTAATNAHAPFGGFLSKGTAAVQDGGTLEFEDTSGGEALLGNFGGGAINVGGTGAGGTLEFDGKNTQFDLSNEGASGGGGTLTLSDNFHNLITGVTGTETFINDTGETLSGAGTISNLALVNNGTILANAPKPLVITPNSSGFTNNGTVQVNAGSVTGPDTNAATNAGLAGFTNTGTITVQDGGAFQFTDTSGKTATLVNVGGSIVVGGAGSGGALLFEGFNMGSTTFDLSNGGSGAGTLTLSDNANNVIEGVVGTETLVNDVGETLSGAGTISNLALVNNGTIIANGTNPLNIKPNGSGFTNNGTVQVNAGSTLNWSGVYTQDAGQTDVNGTLIATSLTIKGGTLASGGGIVETPSLTNGTMITADSTGFIGVGRGKFTATTGYQQLADGTLVELISGASTFGTIDVTGPASLDGTLDVTLENGFIPTVGDQFAFLDFTPGDLTGTFADFLDQTFDNGAGKWGLDYNNSGGDLVLTAEANTTTTTPEPASLLLIGTGLLGLGLLAKKKSWRAIRG